MSVAIVENDPAVLEGLQLVLEEHGWLVRSYANGRDLLNDVDLRRPPRCVLINPDALGPNASHTVRALLEFDSDITIIGTTARPDALATREAVSAGTRLMLTMPVNPEVLVDYVRAALGGTIRNSFRRR